MSSISLDATLNVRVGTNVLATSCDNTPESVVLSNVVPRSCIGSCTAFIKMLRECGHESLMVSGI